MLYLLAGRHFNPEGNLEDWWSNLSVQNYEERLQCIVEQYSAYTLYNGPNVRSGVIVYILLNVNVSIYFIVASVHGA